MSDYKWSRYRGKKGSLNFETYGSSGVKAPVYKSMAKGLFKTYFSNLYFILFLVLVFGLVAFYFLAPSSLRHAFFNNYVLIASLIGLIVGAWKSKFKLSNTLVSIFIAILVVGLLLFYFPFLQSLSMGSAFSTFSKIGGIKDKVMDKTSTFTNPDNYLNKLGISDATFNKPHSEAPAKSTLLVDFPNPNSNEPLSIRANLKVNTVDSLDVGTSCFLDGKEIGIDKSSVHVVGSSLDQTFPFTCSNDKTGNEVIFKAEAPFISESVLETFVGKGSDKGILSSKMLHESPYSLAIDLIGNQPLKDRGQPYSLELKLFRTEKGVKMKKLNSLTLKSKSEKYSIHCSSPFENLKFSADRSKLDKYVVNNKKDAITFVCELDVTDMPSKGNVLSLIEAKAEYVIEKEFKTSLLK